MQIIFRDLGSFNLKLQTLHTCNQYLQYFSLILFALIAALSVINAKAGTLIERQELVINQAYEIDLPEQAASVLLGNADIADIISQTANSVVISGKRIGQTNLLVRDRAQKLVGNILLNVKAAENSSITVYRGTARAEYSCANHCTISSTAIDAPATNATKPLNEVGQANPK